MPMFIVSAARTRVSVRLASQARRRAISNATIAQCTECASA
jgi:hypothetical protein